MRVLFATTNPAKIEKYDAFLKEKNIDLLILKDLNLDLHINENGKDAIENAFIKAKSAYDATKIISIGMDNNLFIEGLPKDKQPRSLCKTSKWKRIK